MMKQGAKHDKFELEQLFEEGGASKKKVTLRPTQSANNLGQSGKLGKVGSLASLTGKPSEHKTPPVSALHRKEPHHLW